MLIVYLEDTIEAKMVALRDEFFSLLKTEKVWHKNWKFTSIYVEKCIFEMFLDSKINCQKK